MANYISSVTQGRPAEAVGSLLFSKTIGQKLLHEQEAEINLIKENQLNVRRTIGSESRVSNSFRRLKSLFKTTSDKR